MLASRCLLVIVLSLPCFAFAKKNGTVALLYNGTNDSSSTSNAVEGHIKKGFQLAIREIGSKDLNFVWINVGEKTDTIVQAFGEIKKANPGLIVGPSHSSQVIVLLKMLKDANLSIPLVTPTATSTELLRYENAVLVSNSNSIQANILMNEIRRENLDRILVVHIKDCSYCSNFVTELEQHRGNTFFTKVTLDEAEIETSPLLSEHFRVKAIVIPALEAETAKIIDRLYRRNPNVIYWGADGVGSLARFVQELNKQNLKFRWLSHYHPDIKEKENFDFIKMFATVSNADPVDTSAFYYEALKFGVSRVLNKKPTNSKLRTVTGQASFDGKQIVRLMPLLELKGNRPELKKMIGIRL